MRRNAAHAIAVLLAGATGLGLACAADPGDPTKSLIGFTSSSSGSSGFTASSSSSGSGSGSESSSSGGFSSSSSSGFGSSSSGLGSSTSGSSSGSSGASGDDGGSDATAPTGATCATVNTSSPSFSYYTDDSGDTPAQLAATQTVHFHFQLQSGLSAINLQDVTVRYWFTADNNPLSGIAFTSYYSQLGGTAITALVQGSFAAAPAVNATPTSDSYLQISFGASSGMLTFGGSVATIEAVFHNASYQGSFNETNDYSFDATKAQGTFKSWDHITVYVKGRLAWGCEPGAGGSSSGSSGTTGSSSSSGSGASSSSSGSGGSDSGTG